ncbi:Alpha/Beta hydrolase protein [Gymnopilus junonius]|uniref:Alpha/Beta hydrolase protein n=1 Tax=Gymnopilus junonius TaxID=109634 RepID=A0A9P5TGC4_GYMJU|nr:Alpha/Beta hydrolase protein [Gymnopilus junonius]
MSSPGSPPTLNGNVTLWGKLWILLTFLRFPLVLLYNLTVTRNSERNKHKSIARLIGDTATRWVSSRLSGPQLQYYFGTSPKTYKAYIKANKLPEVVDELSSGARLLWVGPKQTGNVLLYCHGGGFVTCLADFHLSYCQHLKAELESRLDGKPVGIAVLEYSLAPDFPFPTQLRQLIAAVEHLFSTGVQPDKLHLIGDSAGANLILQLLSHTLHPLPSELVPPSPLIGLSKKVRGIYLMSPWTGVTAGFPSSKANIDVEWVHQDLSIGMGQLILKPVPESQHVYIETAKAPKDWFSGVESITDRILVTYGQKECLVDPIKIVIEALQQYHSSVKVAVQEYGVHNDILQDLFAKEKKINSIALTVDDWLANGYTT